MTDTDASAANVDETVQRIRDLSNKAVELSKQNGLSWLDAYEKMLDGFLKLQQQAAQASPVEWVGTVANTNADLMREMSQAYLGAVREQLK
jgi:hypothetical protein